VIKRRAAYRKSADVSEAFALLAVCFILISCLDYSPTLKKEATCYSETWIDFQGLYGVTFQKRGLFTSIDMRNSDRTNKIIGLKYIVTDFTILQIDGTTQRPGTDFGFPTQCLHCLQNKNAIGLLFLGLYIIHDVLK
jgi:hypothetical protein